MPRLKLIDKYILKKYFSTFFFTAFMFTLISIAIDISENISFFIDKPVTLKQIVVDYYLGFIPYINMLLWPVFILISVIFFTSRLAADTEFIAITAAGISLKRILLPYMMGAAFITLIMLIGNHYVIPKANKSRINIINTYFKPEKNQVNSRDIHLFLDEDTKVFARYYKRADTSIADLWIEHFDKNQLQELLKAKNAKFNSMNNTWTLNNYTIHKFDGIEEEFYYNDKEPLDTVLNLSDADFTRAINQKDMMTSPEIEQAMEIERKKGAFNMREFKIEKYRRTSDAFSIIILSLIGASISSRKVRGGMGVNLAVGMSLGAMFIMLSKVSITFAVADSIPPLLGVWIPNLFFIPVAMYLIYKAQH